MQGIKGVIIAAVAFVALLTTTIVVFSKLTKIDPGHVGVSVDKCDGGGVAKESIPTGYYWRELWCEDVIEYPINMQSLVLTKNPHEGRGGDDGSEMDQSIRVTSSEGLVIDLDVALNFTLESKKVPEIYKKWRASIEDIQEKYIRQTIREGLQLTFAKYTAEDLYSSKKEVARVEVEKFLQDKLGKDGFNVAQFTINRVEPPTQVIQAINAKVAMIQQAQQSQQEVVKKQAEAAQAVAIAEGESKSTQAKAQGEAQAILLKAQAQAQANQILAKSITPELVKYETVRKWSGLLPTYSGGNATPLIAIPAAAEK
jgi:regulator of protease activity HflC (stomatin/prohibitin superfamily)